MKNMIGRLMAMCLVAVSLAAFAQSGDNMKQDSMKHDDMKQDQMNNRGARRAGVANRLFFSFRGVRYLLRSRR